MNGAKSDLVTSGPGDTIILKERETLVEGSGQQPSIALCWALFVDRKPRRAPSKLQAQNVLPG